MVRLSMEENCILNCLFDQLMIIPVVFLSNVLLHCGLPPLNQKHSVGN